MIILSTVFHLFTETEQGYEISRNGGSIMIGNICEYIGRLEQSYVFVGGIRTPAMTYGHMQIVDNTAYLPEHRTKDKIKEWHDGLNKRFREVLSELKPAFVFIQATGVFSEFCINICKEYEQPFALVDHSFHGNKLEMYRQSETAEWERRMFRDPALHIIAVGKGMRNRILEDFPNLNPAHLEAIPNGTEFCGNTRESDLKERLHLLDKKVLLCSGTLHTGKNQIQLVDAFDHLPDDLKERIAILICGKDSIKYPTKERLLQRIEEMGYSDQIIYVGECDHDEMERVYTVADGLIIPSLLEGLSLVALEMMTYGKPIIMFSDNETAVDICDPKVMVLAEDHSDQALAAAMKKWYETDWDQAIIADYSKQFSMEQVAQNYISYCKKRIIQQ